MAQVQLVLIPASQNIQNRTASFPTSRSVEPSAGPATEIAAVQAQKAKATRYRALVSSSTIPVSQQEKKRKVLTEPPKPIIWRYSSAARSRARAVGAGWLARTRPRPLGIESLGSSRSRDGK